MDWTNILIEKINDIYICKYHTFSIKFENKSKFEGKSCTCRDSQGFLLVGRTTTFVRIRVEWMFCACEKPCVDGETWWKLRIVGRWGQLSNTFTPLAKSGYRCKPFQKINQFFLDQDRRTSDSTKLRGRGEISSRILRLHREDSNRNC